MTAIRKKRCLLYKSERLNFMGNKRKQGKAAGFSLFQREKR